MFACKHPEDHLPPSDPEVQHCHQDSFLLLPSLICIQLLNLVLVSEEHLDQMFGSNSSCKMRSLLHNPAVNSSGHLFQENLLFLGLNIGALDLSDPRHWIIDSKVLNNGCQDHPSSTSSSCTVNKTVTTLGEMVDKIQDVVHQVSLCWNLEVWGCSVVNYEVTLLLVEVQ